MGKIFKIFLKTVVSIILFIILVIIGHGINHLITKKDVSEYLPNNSQAYIEVESLKKLFDDIIDLNALEIVTAQDDYNEVFTLLMDFKSSKYSKSNLIKEVLNLKAFVVLKDDYTPSIIIDPGFKSIITRYLPTILKHSEIVVFELIEYKESEIFVITGEDGSNIYFCVENNLILLSPSIEAVQDLIDAKEAEEGIKTRKLLKSLKDVKVKNSIIKFYLNIATIMEGIESEDMVIENLLSMIDFSPLSPISLALSNENIGIESSIDIVSKNDTLKEFLNHKASPLKIIKTLPDSTNIYTAVNFKSFKDFYEILNLLQDDFNFEDYDFLLELFAGLNTDELLFSWTGSEAGLFTVESASEPVIFIEISDQVKYTGMINALDSSIALNSDSSINIDGVVVNRLELSTLIRAGANLINKNSDLPFYLDHNGYLFLSQNPEVLASLVNKSSAGELLIEDKTYKEITSRVPQNANFFFYYDLNTAIPRFLYKSPLLYQLLNEYEKGYLSLFYSDSNISFNFSAQSSESEKNSPFPGYPKKLDGLLSELFVKNITGGDSVEFIYIDGNNTLIISDSSGNKIREMELEERTFIDVLDSGKIVLLGESGTLYYLNGELEQVEPFVSLELSSTDLQPLITSNNIVLYSEENNAVEIYNLNGELLNSIFTSKKLKSQPLLFDNNLYYYPKSLMGTVEGFTITGEEIEGWPQNSYGVSFSTPFKYKNSIGFLNQKGALYLWNKKGQVESNFPVSLDGVFYSIPVEFDNSIVTVNESGALFMINSKGEIKLQRDVDKVNGKHYKLSTEIIDGKDILFLYGGSNNIYAFNNKLQLLPDFPINGMSKPTVVDINSDGVTEVISVGSDNKQHIYSIRRIK